MADDSEELKPTLEGVSNLDTARMTLRWALERIRNLQNTISESQRMLQDSTISRREAVGELDAFKKRVSEREGTLADRERFVNEMQVLLNDLFKGEIQITDFVRRKQAVELERKALEASVRRRLDDVDKAHQREIAEHNRRLANAEKKFDEDLSREREKFAQFKEDISEGARHEEERYHGKLVGLEKEYTAKRRRLQGDFDNLKGILIEEHKASEKARTSAEAYLIERWKADHANLEELLGERAKRVEELETLLNTLERGYHDSQVSRTQEESKRLEDMRRLLQAEQAKQHEEQKRLMQSHGTELEEARQRLRDLEDEAQSDRAALLEQQEHLRRRIDESHFAREKKVREEGEEDLDALRRFYEERMKGQEGRLNKESEAHGDEVSSLRRGHQTRREEAEGQHLQELEKLRTRLHATAEALEAQKAEIVRDQAKLRVSDAEENSKRIREFQAAMETSAQENAARIRQEAIAEIDAVRKQFQELLDKRTADLRAEAEAHRKDNARLRQTLLERGEEPQLLRETEMRRREEAVQSIENFFLEKQSQRTKDTADQLEAMRRHHRRVVNTLRRQFTMGGPPSGRRRIWLFAGGLITLGAAIGALIQLFAGLY
ncbi:MAG: hypothetical protein V3S11_07135 [Elusimicrobiota bacterium]